MARHEKHTHGKEEFFEHVSKVIMKYYDAGVREINISFIEIEGEPTRVEIIPMDGTIEK